MFDIEFIVIDFRFSRIKRGTDVWPSPVPLCVCGKGIFTEKKRKKEKGLKKKKKDERSP